MSRSKVDACIFCEQVPCVCNQPKKATRAKPKAEPKPEPTAAAPSASSHLDAMRAAAAAAPAKPPVQVEPERRKFDPYAGLSEDDIVWNAAIRNLAPLMSEKDREHYAGIITSKPHPEEAKIMWKRRRKSDAEPEG